MMAIAAVAVRMSPKAPQRAATSLSSPATTQHLRTYLDGQPCDRQRIVALGERLAQARQYDELLARSEAFTLKCGRYPRLQWLVYDTHRQRNDWQAAAHVASSLIESDPEDPDYWWWRGAARERHGALEGAARDYREAMARMPWLDHVPLDLANVLDRLDRPCEAIAPLKQYIAAHPSERRSAQARIEALTRKGRGCKNLARYDLAPARLAR